MTPTLRGRGTRRRTLWVLGGILAVGLVLTLIVAGWAWHLNSKLSDVTRFDVDVEAQPKQGASGGSGGSADHSPARPSDSPGTTILLAGVDNGDRADLRETLASGNWRSGVFRSDAILVLHLSEDRDEASLVSIPRDSWVPINGHGTQKINAAFSYGGPALLTRTVEQVTDTRMDHIAVVDWNGFKGVTEVLGGVQMRGRTYGPEEALEYVRTRKTLANGDFDRMQRQQEFLMGVLRGVRSRDVLTSPQDLTGLVGSLAELVAVDQDLSNQKMVRLGYSARGLAPQEVELLTAPHLGTDREQGQSIVRLDVDGTQRLFDSLVGS